MKASICIDMNGCPNRCRHCWLGHGTNKHLDIDDFLWACRQFREYQKDGQPFFEALGCETWFREPDFSANYRELWELEVSLNEYHKHHELISVSRLARDEDYGPWLKSIGLETAQLTFFGMEKSTDSFTGRKGSYHDLLTGIDVLIENNIAPRIQIFPFRTTIDDFHALEDLFMERKLEERTHEIGKEFVVFINTPAPLGKASGLESMCLTRGDLARLPSRFLESTLKHFKADDPGKMWRTETEWLGDLIYDERPLNDVPPMMYFMITPDFDVYPNEGEIAPWWYLGNLKRDGIDSVRDSFERRKPPGLHLNREVPVKVLARKYGEDLSDVLWSKTGLVHRWIRREGSASVSV